MAVDVGRFADELEATTDLDAKVLRYWQAERLEIASTLTRAGPADRGRAIG